MSIVPQAMGRNAEEGFSLIEVLACIAIFAIICIPILSGFGTSSYYNSRSYHTQNATSFAQQVTEEMKRMTRAEFEQSLLQYASAHSGTVFEKQELPDEALWANLQTIPGVTREICTVYEYYLKKVDIGGAQYDLKAVFDPTPYSDVNSSNPASSADANSSTEPEVQDIDGMKYPLIAEEISKYEKKEGTGIPAAYLKDLSLLLPENVRSSVDMDTLYAATCKTTDVSISPVSGDADAIRVVCDVTYEVPAHTIKKTYNVYNGIFRLREIIKEDGRHLSGRVYLFAKAYRDSQVSGMISDNTIRITNHYSGDPLEIYLVRGYYGKSVSARYGVNFDHVLLNEGGADMTYSSLAPGENPNGRWLTSDSAPKLSKTDFYTNIKGTNLNRIMTEEDMEQTIGQEQASIRCWRIEVTLTDAEDSSSTAAQIITTKGRAAQSGN